MPVPVDLARRRQLDDVEQAEQQERDGDVHRLEAGEEQHQQERGDFVDHDRARVGRAEVARGHGRRPDADREQRRDRQREAQVAGDRPKAEGDRNRDQRPERSRREGRKAAAEAEGDEMRRVAQQETQRRRRAHARARAKWSNARGRLASGAFASSSTVSPRPATTCPMRVTAMFPARAAATTASRRSAGAANRSS